MEEFVLSVIGKKIHDVIFICDYLQIIVEDGTVINAYNETSVVGYGNPKQSFTTEYVSLVIGRVISKVIIEDENLFVLELGDSMAIEISLRPADYEGPEAINIYLASGGIFSF